MMPPLRVNTLLAALLRIPAHWLLEKNDVGNLVIVDDSGEVKGHLDLQTGEVDWWESNSVSNR